MRPNRSRAWKRIGDVELCEFDRLLLARAVDVHEGSLDGVAGELRGARLEPTGDRSREADLLLSQFEDLRERLALLHAAPADLVGPRPLGADQGEPFLFDFVCPEEQTQAMWSRNAYLRLVERAIRGPWERFPISPAPRAASWTELVMTPGDEYERFDHLQRQVEDALERAASAADRLAIRRAEVTTLLTFLHHENLGDQVDEIVPTLDRYAQVDHRETGIDAACYWDDYVVIASAFVFHYLLRPRVFGHARAEDVPMIAAAFDRLRSELARARACLEEETWTQAYASFVGELDLRDRFLEVVAIPHVRLETVVDLAQRALDGADTVLARAILDAREPRYRDAEEACRRFEALKSRMPRVDN